MYAGGNFGKGNGDGTDTSYVNSHVGSKDSQTIIQSGNATNIIGGQVQGKGVQIDAKELNIESLQDKATYKAKQQNISGQATVGYGASVSGSYNQSSTNANYASVTEQSGIFAGDDGYQINVKNNTDLKGAIITSNQKAEDAGKNSLSTGTLTTSDIHNITEYDAKGIGVSGSVSVSGKTLGQDASQEGDTVQLQNVGDKGNSKSVGFGLDSDKDSSVTRSGINTKNITITETTTQQALTGKTAEQAKADVYTTTSTETAKENNGALSNNFDKDKVQSEIGTQIAVTKQFGENAPKAVADYSQQQVLKLQAQGNLEEAEKWKEGGIYRVALHTAIGALSTGTVEGALATGGIATAAPMINQFEQNIGQALINKGMKADTAHMIANAVISASIAGAGIATGLDTGSTATAVNVDSNNRQLHRDEVDLIQKMAKQYAKEKGISEEAAATLLTRGALYNIDEGWKNSIDDYKAEEVEQYQQAYQYLLSQSKDNSVSELNAQLSGGSWRSTEQLSDGTKLHTMNVISVGADSYAGRLSDAEQVKADDYINRIGKGFTATAEDFKNKDVFLTNTLAGSSNKESDQYNDKKAFIEQHGAIKQNEIGFWEGVRSDVDRDVSTVKGGVGGIATGVVNTVTGVIDYLLHPIDNTKALIDGTIDAVSHPIATGEKAITAVDQGLEKYNTSIDLYRMQHDEGAEAEYKSGILGEIVGSGGVGAAAKKGIEITVDAAKGLKEANAAKQAAEVAKQKQMVENNHNKEDYQQYDHYRQDNAIDRGGNSIVGGNWDWDKQAPNGGAIVGTRTERITQVDEILDRFGSDNGRYLANKDATLEQRSLPPGTNRPDSYHQYKVLKPFEIVEEEIAPAFGQIGGGKQILPTDKSINVKWLLDHNYIEEVK